MTLENFNNFEVAYGHVLNDIKKYGHQVSPRGRESTELLGAGFIITNPTNRLIGIPERKLNIFYAIGNFLWVMSQSNDLSFIEYYNPKGKDFSEDGKTLPAAYGKRIFNIDGINQYNNCINELKLDPNSRRALINIHMAQYDWRGYLDTSCTSDFQFFIRDGYLTTVNHMRSQSAAMVMPYDIFLMTMIHEFTARVLGVKMGEYQHFCNSLHYYNIEQPIVDNIIASKHHTKQMDYMPEETDMIMLKEVLRYEKAIREESYNVSVLEDIALDAKDFPKYWMQIIYLLIAKRYQMNGFYDSYKSFIDSHLKDSVYYPFL